VNTGPDGIRFLLVSGKPLREPVAWHSADFGASTAVVALALEDDTKCLVLAYGAEVEALAR
jgi:quercetin 2,3-dioxygenase